ncbi:MAG: SUMF1/EgtB/PvdO family nonheme iron enzyme, partial [Polyangiaceae bacterium]|nr:SUMF1/EgtB/PvdO family nonheme iron enzyme [Polyangiaceae bacterium]
MNVRGRWLAVIGGLGMLAAAGGCSGSSDEGGTPSSGGSAGVGATGGGGGTGGQGGAAGAAGSSGAGSCTPGAKQCVGSTPRTCSSSGAWESGSACADQACVDGACIGVCSPDAVRCSGDVAQKCDVGGQWVTTVACTNQACVNGACTGSCTPGAKQCSGSTPQTCSSSGAWESGSACANQACVNGECTGSCAPGAKQCAGNMPQTCSSSGTWESGSACAGATPTCYAGACVSQPSCADPGQGRTDCGSGGNESCCTSRLVKGGTFYRGYTEPPGSTGYKTKDYPATVADFRLDEYEVTVGRFRKFVEAWVDGWRPVAGAGKHTHLNGGLGLVNGGAGGGNEPGWDASWSSELAQSTVDWDTNLACYSGYETWTPSAGGNENRPINCASWYELQAFCIWDGGFLPSETEWHYAASGGSEQRKYPWGNTDPGANA